jgi:hypothetical protein
MSSAADCKYSRQFDQIAEETIFTIISPAASPEQVKTAQQSLEELLEELLRQIAHDTFHFSAANGGHRCVEACFQVATFRLKHLSLLTPPPTPEQPASEPAPPPQPMRTLKDVVRALGDTLQPRPDGIPIGFDDELPEDDAAR